MQNAETVLGVLRERGRRGLPCEELYRQLFNPQLYLLAYGRIYANKGAMTPGVTRETVDGMSLGKIDRIIDAMRHERYRFRPVRRVYIPKKNGKTRPLGLPTWSDKLVGEVVRLLLEAYYEPTFSDRSHGFRPGRGCHTALREVADTWTGTTWFIEGDIADCFGSLRPRGHARDPGGEDPRQPVPAAGAQHAHGRIPGGLEVGRHAAAARRRAGWRPRSCPTSTCTGWTSSSRQVLIPEYTRGRLRATQPGVPRRWNSDRQEPAGDGDRAAGAVAAPAAAQPAQPGSRRSRLPAAALLPLRRRPPARVRRTEGRSRGDQTAAGGVPA